VKDEPCRCIEDGLQSPHQINWDTDENTCRSRAWSGRERPPASEMWLLARSDESVAADAGQQNILTHAVYAERASASTGHDPGRFRCTCLEDEVMVIVNAVYASC